MVDVPGIEPGSLHPNVERLHAYLALGPGAILHFAAYPSGAALLMSFGPC